jgi:hypothetical protein
MENQQRYTCVLRMAENKKSFRLEKYRKNETEVGFWEWALAGKNEETNE